MPYSGLIDEKKIVPHRGACRRRSVAAWYVLRMDQGDGMAYLTEPVTIGNITRTVNATGEVGAVQLVSVGAQVGGQIKKLHGRPQGRT